MKEAGNELLLACSKFTVSEVVIGFDIVSPVHEHFFFKKMANKSDPIK